MLAFAIAYGAPWYFMAPVGIASAIAIWAIVSNPHSGADLDKEQLIFFSQGTQTTVLTADIANMKVSRWSDGPDTVALTLTSGHVVHVPGLCADSNLAPALRSLGIVENSTV